MSGETILVVDDEPKIVKQARDYLERSGYRVLVAGDGPTAVSIAAHEQPDLVVLDIMLAGEIDGNDAASRIREFSDVPIIMLTHTVRERQMNAALRQIESLESIHGAVSRIRLEHLDCD